MLVSYITIIPFITIIGVTIWVIMFVHFLEAIKKGSVGAIPSLFLLSKENAHFFMRLL